MSARILIIEDEKSLREALSYSLELDAYDTVAWGTGREGLAEMERGRVDIVLLDVGLPDCNGFDLFHQIRAIAPVPIIFLTARVEEVDKVSGLEQGADDYITKPFSPRELAARVRSVLRRTQDCHESPTDTAAIQASDQPAIPFEVSDDQLCIRFRGTALDLTRYEYRLLRQLVRRPGVVFTREQLLELVWEEPEESCDRSVDSHIKSIRAKLKIIDPHHDAILTRRGIGYTLRADW